MTASMPPFQASCVEVDQRGMVSGERPSKEPPLEDHSGKGPSDNGLDAETDGCPNVCLSGDGDSNVRLRRRQHPRYVIRSLPRLSQIFDVTTRFVSEHTYEVQGP